jgi:hypothetical protein
MKKEIRTEVIIQANENKVYDIITNLEDYENWNPFIVRSEGKPVKGEKLINTMINGESKMTFKPKVKRTDTGKAFEWLGSLWFKGLFDGHHFFHIEKIDDKSVKLIHGERFSGILSGMILNKIGEETRNNFILMNRAIKEKAES